MKSNRGIPIVDFAQAQSSPEQLARELLTACIDWGKPLTLLVILQPSCHVAVLICFVIVHRVFLHQEPPNPAKGH
jgi:hypothetical protein